MCLSCLNFAPQPHSPVPQTGHSRRNFLKQASALGLALPLALHGLRPASAAEAGGPAPGEFLAALKELIARATSPELVAFRTFEIKGSDLPWTDIGLNAAKGHQITFLLTGRMWLSREYDLWFNPGLAFHARTRGAGPMYSPMLDTGTMVAAHDGGIEVARSAAEWATPDGVLRTPESAYRKADVSIIGAALVWRGEASAGIASLLASGDAAGLLAAERSRLAAARKLPDGCTNLFMLGGGQEIFQRDGNGDIVCESAGNAAIIEHSLPMPLATRPKLSWSWKIGQLPAVAAEDQAATHDYLSIGVKFEDGQDLTYLWSERLAKGKVFRCPLQGWDAIETHMVIRSGAGELGSWQAEERDIQADYASFIGGPAQAISQIWLLAVTPFQRRRGACRYRDIAVTAQDGTVRRL